MPTTEPPFAQIVLRHFDFLRQTYAFRVTETTEHWVVLENQACKIMVVLDRIDLFVDISSVESEPVRRIRFSLGTLLEVKGVNGPQRTPQTLDQRVQQVADLLAGHGSDILAGDWSIRAQIVRCHTLQWLEAKYGAVMAQSDQRAREERIEQLVFAYHRQNQEHRHETWQCLDEWLHTDDGQRRAFAELVVARL